MIVQFIKRFVLICLMFIAVGCNVNKGNSSRTQMKDTVQFTGCQEKISLKADDILEIRLEAIQGTGYQWVVKEPLPFLQQLESDVLQYSPAEGKEPTPGLAGYQILRFKVLSKGEGVIQLEYKRTFEGQVEKSCEMKIKAE